MTSSTSETIPSIRASCDRCHFQKLKCPSAAPSNGQTSTTPGACLRCQRAKVPCTYGRRTRRKRGTRTEHASQRLIPTKETPGTAAASKDNHLVEVMNVDGLETSNGAEVLQDLDLIESKDATSGLRIATSDLQRPDAAWFCQTPFSDDTTLCRDTRRQMEFMFQDVGLFFPDNIEMLLNQPDTSAPDSLTSGSTFAATGVSDDNNRGEGGLVELVAPHESSQPQRHSTKKKVLSLASELQDRLESLEEMSRRKEIHRQDSIRKYPIGSVVHLSQRFSTLTMSLGTCTINEEQDDDNNDRLTHPRCRSCSQRPPHSAMPLLSSWISARELHVAEATTILILLSCYLTLLQIYSTVLRHFKDHLAMRGESIRTLTDLPSATSLGDLTPTNVSYNQIYEGTCIVFSSLQEATAALGFSPELNIPTSHSVADSASPAATSLVDQEVKTSASNICRSYSEIQKQLADMKDLLRTKMGL